MIQNLIKKHKSIYTSILIIILFSCLLTLLNVDASIISGSMNDNAWYRKPVLFSKWEKVRDYQFDYATNKHVCNFYTPSNSEYLRNENVEKFNDRLMAGDSLIVGIDYYALFNISYYFFPPDLLAREYETLINGDIAIYKFYLDNKHETIFMEKLL